MNGIVTPKGMQARNLRHACLTGSVLLGGLAMAIFPRPAFALIGLAGECGPLSTQQWLYVAAITLLAAIIFFFLFVRLMERVFIKNDRDAILGRHLGISLSLALTIGTLCLAGYLIKKCWWVEFTWVAGFAAAIWVLHMVYVLIAVRR